MVKLPSFTVAVAALCQFVTGHIETPEEARKTAETRERISSHARQQLHACANSVMAKDLRRRAVARRARTAERIRHGRGLIPRKNIRYRRDRVAFEHYNGLSHDLTYQGYDSDTPLDAIFGSDPSCALVPETVIGPYYVEGEIIRSDIVGGESGIPSHLDFQFIDINSCEGVADLLIDVWYANSTGKYSAVSTPGQGGLKTNFGRGVQQTDGDGVVQFDAIFPGHYTGRTNHYHVMSTAGATVLANGTFEGGTVRHIGQTYFDTSLIEAVEATEPYSLNEEPITSNSDDGDAADEATAEYDPFMKYVYLGNKVTDGLLIWITIGIDPKADYGKNRRPAAHWHPDGSTDKTEAETDHRENREKCVGCEL